MSKADYDVIQVGCSIYHVCTREILSEHVSTRKYPYIYVTLRSVKVYVSAYAQCACAHYKAVLWNMSLILNHITWSTGRLPIHIMASEINWHFMTPHRAFISMLYITESHYHTDRDVLQTGNRHVDSNKSANTQLCNIDHTGIGWVYDHSKYMFVITSDHIF